MRACAVSGAGVVQMNVSVKNGVYARNTPILCEVKDVRRGMLECLRVGVSHGDRQLYCSG